MTLQSALRSISLAAIAGVSLAAAPAASADTSQSSNWAGYAVHHGGTTFRKVVGAWTQPLPICTPGEPTYSSVWIGIGGYSVSSPALEQVGTEADCTAGGAARSSAWFELVPAASQAIRMPVAAGDRIRATVSIAGRTVTLSLQDLTGHRTFSRTMRASVLDTTSAEWIVEAPSVCSSADACQTLPLADFGSTGFTATTAQPVRGAVGAIADRRWTATRITLAEAGRRFIGGGGSAAVLATASPSALTSRGSAFTIRYQGSAGAVSPSVAKLVATARLVHGPALSPGS
jgi:peptidase A4-like protein